MSFSAGRENLKTLYIMQILNERTDEAHSLSAARIGSILKSEYGITITRQTIYTEIEKLENAGMDIVRRDGRLGGFYVASRQFELPELKLMVDAVQSSRFITRKKSEELIRKLETLCSREEAKQLSSQVVVCNRTKTTNETIYYNVDKLHSSIYDNRQISFQYVKHNVRKKAELRHGGALYRVSPLHLVWDNENYYLIAFDENAGKVKHYRVDKMRSMMILDEPRSEEAFTQKVDLASFDRKTFGMFGGRDAQVRLVCRNDLADVVLDRFGPEIIMIPSGAEEFAVYVTVTVSPQFFGWVTALGQAIRIEEPDDIRKEYMEHLDGILRNYTEASGLPPSGA